MQAIRQFHRVRNRKIEIVLPENFSADEVEIIILPSENGLCPEESPRHGSLHNLLLEGPTSSDDDLKQLQDIHTWMSGWNAREF
jgi:hypothetical protein